VINAKFSQIFLSIILGFKLALIPSILLICDTHQAIANNIESLTQDPPTQPEDIPPVTPSPAPTPNENTDEIFERVFKRPKPTGVQRVIVPFYINDLEQGQMIVFVSLGGNNNLQMTGATLLKKMAEYARPDIQTRLEGLVDQSGNLTLTALQSTGINATFNERSLELRIEIPPNLRKTIIYGSGNTNIPKEAANALRPSNLSAFINLRGTQLYAWEGDSQSLGRQPLNLGLDGAINYQGWVLEGSGSFTEKSDAPWTRADIRLVKDDPDNAVRYILGDLFGATRGYQSFIPMAGLAMFRNFSLQPYLVTLPTGQFDFFLERPSRVEIFVNGLLRQTLQLPAGPQDIRNFSLNAGLNNITLKITDNVGQTRDISFSAPLAYDLLDVGLQQFAVGVGVPSYTQDGVRSYDTNRPILTGFYRQGITNTLTLGGYLQAAGAQQLLGTEGTLATSLGNIGWDAAIASSHGGFDHSFRLRYQYLALGGNQSNLPTFGLEAEYLGPYFQRFGNLSIGNPLNIFTNSTNNIAWNFGANYGQTLFDGLGINLNLGYQIGSFHQPNAYRAAIGLTGNLGNGLQLNLTLNNRQDQTGRRETQLLVNLLQISQRQSLSIRNNLSTQQEQATEITWNSNSPSQYNSINTTIGLRNSPQPSYTGAIIGLDYRGFLGNLNLSHNYDQSRQESNLSFGTALVYADGHFGWTRPVTDSFVMVARNDNFADQLVTVNPGLYGAIAEASSFGPAVVPDLSSYTVTTIRVDAPNMPLGYDLGKTVYSLLPSYKSGMVITVGTEATVFLRGILKNSQDQPIGLQAGQVTSLSDPSWEPVTLFTNKVGKFALLGLKPGRYELKLFTEPPQSTQFEIPADKTGIFDLGNLTIR